MSKVIHFPKSKKDSPPQTLEEIQDSIHKIRTENLNGLTEQISTTLLSVMGSQGIDVAHPDYMNLNAFMIELTKAFVSKSMNMDHVLIQMAEKHFVCVDDEGYLHYEYNFEKTTEE